MNTKKSFFGTIVVLAVLLSIVAYGEEKQIQYARIYVDSNGESHFEDVGIKFTPSGSGSQARNLSFFPPATQYGFYCFPPGTFLDWHPAPRRQMLFHLSGEVEVKVSDGEVRRFKPGSILYVEDTTGKGHVTRVVGNDELLTAIVVSESRP